MSGVRSRRRFKNMKNENDRAVGQMNSNNFEHATLMRTRAWASVPRGGLALIWSGFMLVAAFVLWHWGIQGFPLGSYWWDELALSGGAHAIRQGLVPTVDFWAPFILPLYLKVLAQNWAGVAAGYVVECLLQGAVILLLLSVLLGRQRHGPSIYLVGAWVVAMAMLPFNLGSVAEAEVGSVAFAGSYNRFGGALIGLVMMLPVARRDDSRDFVLTGWLALVFVLALFVKITVLQVVGAVCLAQAGLCGDAGWRRLLLRAVLLAVAAAMLSLHWFDDGAGYFSALRGMSELRMQGMRERLEVCRMLLVQHRLELFVLLLVALLVSARGCILRQVWVGQVTCYLISIALLTLYTLTNFGDNGFSLSVVATLALLFSMEHVERAPTSAGTPQYRYAAILWRTSRWLWVALFVGYGGLHAYYALSLVRTKVDSQAIHVPAATEFIRRNFTIDRQAWEGRIPIAVSGVPVNERLPSTYAAYVAGLDEAALFLTQYVPDRSRSIYALDFPAYVFSLIEGYRVPRGGYPWLLYGHELTIDAHPASEVLFKDIDVIMVSKCSVASGNRRFLARIYRVELEKNWRMMASLTCWDAYERK